MWNVVDDLALVVGSIVVFVVGAAIAGILRAARGSSDG